MTPIGALLDGLDEDDLKRLAESLRPYLETEGGWLDLKAAAAYAGTTVPSLRHAIKTGALEVSQRDHGAKVYVRKSALNAWRM
jgi:hypothetical protein